MSGNISALRTHQFRVWSCANRPLLACQVVRSQISCLGEFSIAPRIGGMARLVHDCGSGEPQAAGIRVGFRFVCVVWGFLDVVVT
jgi:hypothetical protein